MMPTDSIDYVQPLLAQVRARGYLVGVMWPQSPTNRYAWTAERGGWQMQGFGWSFEHAALRAVCACEAHDDGV